MIIKNRDELEELLDGDGDWEEVDGGEWVQDYEYQFKTVIVLHVPTGKHYQYSISRSGSPFTDWYYDYEGRDYPELYEVEKATRTITEEYWRLV